MQPKDYHSGIDPKGSTDNMPMEHGKKRVRKIIDKALACSKKKSDLSDFFDDHKKDVMKRASNNFSVPYKKVDKTVIVFWYDLNAK
jgi:hypothetical protein